MKSGMRILKNSSRGEYNEKDLEPMRCDNRGRNMNSAQPTFFSNSYCKKMQCNEYSEVVFIIGI